MLMFPEYVKSMLKSVSWREPVLERLCFPVVALYFLRMLCFCHKNQFRLSSSLRSFQCRVLSGIEAPLVGEFWGYAPTMNPHAKRGSREERSMVVKGNEARTE